MARHNTTTEQVQQQFISTNSKTLEIKIFLLSSLYQLNHLPLAPVRPREGPTKGQALSPTHVGAPTSRYPPTWPITRLGPAKKGLNVPNMAQNAYILSSN